MRKQKRIDLIASFGIAAVFLLVLSKNSPLYPMNDWVDVQCFLTMGKGILHGIVPYQELYEQKGPVLYFLFALAALIDQHSFIGVYLLETAAVAAFLYYSLQILRLYLNSSLWLYAALPVLMAALCTCPAYAHGGSVESLSLWLLAYGIYTVLLALRQQRLLRWQESFWIGVGAAAVVYMKFTIAGFYLGLALFVAIWYLAYERRPQELLKTIGAFFAGIGALSLPVFGYFAFHGAVKDFLTAYFYNNMFLYPTEVADRWALIWQCLRNTLPKNAGWGSLVQLGLLWMLLRSIRWSKESLAVLLSFLGLTAGTYGGGRAYIYYGLILSAYAPLGLAALGGILRWDKVQLPSKLRHWAVPCAVSLALAAVLLNNSYTESSNTYLLGEKRENMPAYQFAETINQVENATLLNYGFLDGGFYYAADVLPTTRFFCTLNIPLDEMWQEHQQTILNGDVDFVVTRKYELSAYGLDSGYVCVQTAQYYFEGTEYTYYLYQREDLP